MSNTSATRSRPSWVVPLLVLVVAAALVIFVLTQGGAEDAGGERLPDAPGATGAVPVPDSGQDVPSEVAEPQQPDLRELERRDEADLLTAGPVDAPVTLIVFSDYQCPFCAQWSQDTLPEMREYVDAGDLRIEWRDVNVFGEASERASHAAYAAAEQGKFWEFHDTLFVDGDIRPAHSIDEDGLVALAEGLDLDGAQFRADMASEETQAQILENQALGLDIGAFSTPTFILGGQPIVGAQPTPVFTQAMDEALARESR